MYVCVSLSLSIYIYIYINTYTHMFSKSSNDGRTLMVSTDMKRIDFRVSAPEKLIKDHMYIYIYSIV